MRIVAGTLRGRKLKTPDGRDIRPTSDKIRGAIFNALAARGVIEGARVLDAFCGTGAMGLEAISRGAASCLFTDTSQDALALARANAAAFDVDSQCMFRRADAANPGKADTNFDLAFIDPPYRKGLIAPALAALDAGGWIADNAFIVIESEAEFSWSAPGCDVISDKTYGESRVMIVSKNLRARHV